ncbi:tRNA (guanine-N1)-methyltransferase [Pontimicrobium sp. IMCC45349]|jgi:type II secretory pathway pseudopilin PulG|uniref:tRNA (guanine-N1)-methyltransferase n=1 Tax=Pontimicrobium sp. IMCC45349 TaxID=3391574 RepID=UPI0039A1EFCE
MKFFKLSVLLLLTVTLHTSIQAQNTASETDKLSLNEGTIDNQFDYVIKKSNRYQEFKVVKQTWLHTLKAHTLDSLKAIKKQLNDTKAVVTTQQEEIDTLKNNLSTTQTTLDNTNKEKDSMALFGMQMSKGGYNTLMWSIIAGLLALLMLFIYKFKSSNAVTKAAKKSLAETELEFEEHRRVALEREQKVRRQLQDEINKHKNNS